MGKNSQQFLNHQEEQYYLSEEFFNTIPEAPQPTQYTAKKDTDRAAELLAFMQECLHTMECIKKLIEGVDKGEYIDTVFNTAEYRDCLIVNYQHSAILHSQTLDAYIKITGKISAADQFYNTSKRHAA